MLMIILKMIAMLAGSVILQSGKRTMIYCVFIIYQSCYRDAAVIKLMKKLLDITNLLPSSAISDAFASTSDTLFT